MIEPVLTKEGQETLDTIISIRPSIMREGWKKKISRIISFLMNEQGGQEAGRGLVIEAAKIVTPKIFDPFFHMMEDRDKFRRLTIDAYVDMEAYDAVPKLVKRWKSTARKPAKRPEEMKVIAFCASPRKGGNTDVLIDEALRGVKDAGAKGEKIRLQSLKLGFCLGCRKCKEPGFERICAVKDDMSDIYQKIMDSDAIIIGFPVYTGRECAQLSTFFDRWDCFERFEHSSILKPGRRAMVIGTWGYAYDDTYDEVMETVMMVLNLHKIETVEALSACGFAGMLHGFDDKKKAIISRYPKELEKAYQAGKSLVFGDGTAQQSRHHLGYMH